MSSPSAVICREVFDENSQPSAEEISEYAQQLGIDPESESHLLPLARDGLMQALPAPWKAYYDEKLQTHYYYNEDTKKTQWEHPLDKVYKELVRKARDASIQDDTCASVQELLTFEENPKILERIETKVESDDEDLTTESSRHLFDKQLPKRLAPLGRPPLAPLTRLDKKLGDLKMSPLRRSIDNHLKPVKNPDFFRPERPKQLFKQQSEIIDLKINVLNSPDDDNFRPLLGAKVGNFDRGLPLTGKGSMFFKIPKSDNPSPDTDKSFPLDSMPKSDPPKGILRDKLCEALQRKADTVMLGKGRHSGSLDEDKKSVRFKLENVPEPSTISPGSNSSSDPNDGQSSIVIPVPSFPSPTNSVGPITLAPIALNHIANPKRSLSAPYNPEIMESTKAMQKEIKSTKVVENSKNLMESDKESFVDSDSQTSLSSPHYLPDPRIELELDSPKFMETSLEDHSPKCDLKDIPERDIDSPERYINSPNKREFKIPTEKANISNPNQRKLNYTSEVRLRIDGRTMLKGTKYDELVLNPDVLESSKSDNNTTDSSEHTKNSAKEDRDISKPKDTAKNVPKTIDNLDGDDLGFLYGTHGNSPTGESRKETVDSPKMTVTSDIDSDDSSSVTDGPDARDSPEDTDKHLVEDKVVCSPDILAYTGNAKTRENPKLDNTLEMTNSSVNSPRGENISSLKIANPRYIDSNEEALKILKNRENIDINVDMIRRDIKVKCPIIIDNVRSSGLINSNSLHLEKNIEPSEHSRKSDNIKENNSLKCSSGSDNEHSKDTVNSADDTSTNDSKDKDKLKKLGNPEANSQIEKDGHEKNSRIGLSNPVKVNSAEEMHKSSLGSDKQHSKDDTENSSDRLIEENCPKELGNPEDNSPIRQDCPIAQYSHRVLNSTNVYSSKQNRSKSSIGLSNPDKGAEEMHKYSSGSDKELSNDMQNSTDSSLEQNSTKKHGNLGQDIPLKQDSPIDQDSPVQNIPTSLSKLQEEKSFEEMHKSTKLLDLKGLESPKINTSNAGNYDQDNLETAQSPKRRVLRPPAADYIKPDLFQKNFQKISDLVRPGDIETSPVHLGVDVEKDIRPRSPLIPQQKNKISINLMESIESETSSESPDKEYANLDLNDIEDEEIQKESDKNPESDNSNEIVETKDKIYKNIVQNTQKEHMTIDSYIDSPKRVPKLDLIAPNQKTHSDSEKSNKTESKVEIDDRSHEITSPQVRSPKFEFNKPWSTPLATYKPLNKAVIAPLKPTEPKKLSPRLDGVILQGKATDSGNVVVVYQFESQDENYTKVKSPLIPDQGKDILERNKADEKKRLELNLQKELESIRIEFATRERRMRLELERELRETENKFLEEKKLRLSDQLERQKREMENALTLSEQSHQDSMEALQKTIEERRRKDIEMAEKRHAEDMAELEQEYRVKLQAKRQQLEIENERALSELCDQLQTNFVRERTRMIEENRSTLEALREEHTNKVTELRHDYRAEVDRLRTQHACHLEELRARLANERALRPEDRGLADKYKCLKEKYARLKHDVKMSIERRNKRREMSVTTGSETEKSNSHKANQSLERCKELNETSVSAVIESEPRSRNNNLSTSLNRQNDNETSHSESNAAKYDRNNGNSKGNDLSNHPATSSQSQSSGKKPPRRATVAFKDPLVRSGDRIREIDNATTTDYQDSSDATTADEKPKESVNGHGRRRCFTRLKSASTSRLNYSPKRGEGWSSPLEALRQQLRKLDDLEEQFPDLACQPNYSLRYPFGEIAAVSKADTPELEFVRHRALVEREGMRRARAVLKRRRAALKENRGETSPHRATSEDRETTELEVALHRARALLGEKEIRLRHIERALRKMADVHTVPPPVIQEATTSDASSVSEAGDQEATGAVLRSLKALHADVRDIWRALDVRPRTASPEMSSFNTTASQNRMTLSAPVPVTQDNSDNVAERARGLRAWLHAVP